MWLYRCGLTRERIRLISWCLHKMVRKWNKILNTAKPLVFAYFSCEINSYKMFYNKKSVIEYWRILRFYLISEIGKGKLTVGKIYGGLLILENWKTTKFGRIPNSQRPVDTYCHYFISISFAFENILLLGYFR